MFTSLERGFAHLEGHVPTQSFPKAWASAAISLGSIKLLGGGARGQNSIVQHLLVDGGMVAGHQGASALGITERAQGGLARQMIQAEALNLGMKASLAFLHGLSPRLSALERSLDLTFKFQEMGRDPRFFKILTQGTVEIAGRACADGKAPSSPRPEATGLILMAEKGGGSKDRYGNQIPRGVPAPEEPHPWSRALKIEKELRKLPFDQKVKKLLSEFDGLISQLTPKELKAVAKRFERWIEKERDDEEFDNFNETGKGVSQAYVSVVSKLAPNDQWHKAEKIFHWVHSGQIPRDVQGWLIAGVGDLGGGLASTDLSSWIYLLERNLINRHFDHSVIYMLMESMPNLIPSLRIGPALKIAERFWEVLREDSYESEYDLVIQEVFIRSFDRISSLLAPDHRLTFALRLTDLAHEKFEDLFLPLDVERMFLQFEKNMPPSDRETFRLACG